MPDKNSITICPYCSSDNVVKKKNSGYAIMLSMLLLGLPLPFFDKRNYCFNCKKEWKQTDI